MTKEKSGFEIYFGWWLWKKKLVVEIDWETRSYQYTIKALQDKK